MFNDVVMQNDLETLGIQGTTESLFWNKFTDLKYMQVEESTMVRGMEDGLLSLWKVLDA